MQQITYPLLMIFQESYSLDIIFSEFFFFFLNIKEESSFNGFGIMEELNDSHYTHDIVAIEHD